jgi:uncharacterized protein YndB with AHSA1/START domain
MTSHDQLPHRLERTIDIQAERETVFRFFTDGARWASWWGAGSEIDPQVGGKVLIRYPGGVEVTGNIVEVVPPERLVFTYGFVQGQPVPPGGSLVTIELEARGAATRLHLSHAFAEPTVRNEHVQGWRYQLSLFANVVKDDLHANAAELADEWFAAWSAEPAVAEMKIRTLAAANLTMRDRFSAIAGVDDVLAHIAAARRFMPGIVMQRNGLVCHCQGMVLADWIAQSDGQERASGTNVFILDSHGRIEAVTGFWRQSK